MFEKLEACPSCNNSDIVNHLIATDYSISGDSFAISKCQNCELIFTNPRPTEEQIGKYYQSENYISHSNKTKSITDTAYKAVRSISLRRKRKLIESYTSNKCLLDFGCGTGYFLRHLQQHNWEIDGIEPNNTARETATHLLHREIHSSLDQLTIKYDVVTAWHVFEHVHSIKDTILSLRDLLQDNGYMIVAVPNINSHDFQTYQEHWAGLDVPRHLYHFSQASFLTLAESCKLKLIDTHPMKFDSFYVSLLSEKYKYGKVNYIRAFRSGRESNKKAVKTGEYSSLIFILRK